MKKFVLAFLFAAGFAVTASSQFTGQLGYALSPQGFPNDFSQMGTFLQETASLCGNGIVYANGDWRDDTASSGIIPNLQKTISQLQPNPYGYTDMLTYAWATYPALHLNTLSDPTNNWTNSDMRSRFLQMLIRTADSLQPAYLFIGNEVDLYLTIDSLDYYNWISFYETAYDSVKAHSPGTKVGTVFSYEHLSGNGTLTGSPEWMTPHWNALDDMDTSKMDMVGISFYPFFQYASANAVPNTYLDPMFTHISNKPLVFTETGWPGDSLIGPWNANAQEQVDFVNKLFTLVGAHNVPAVNWFYLNYMMSNSISPDVLIFKSVALRDSLGNDRPALALWQSMCAANAISEEETLVSVVPYPDPSSGEFRFRGLEPEETHTLILLDMQGREVFRREVKNDETVAANLSPGLYFYTITGRSGKNANGKILITAP